MIIRHEDCYYLGYISKTQGFKGQLIAFFDVDDLRAYQKTKRILVDIGGNLHPFFIATLNLKDKNFVQMSLEGIASEDQGLPLCGKEIYLPLTDLPALPDEQYYLHDLAGMKVIDANAGEIGEVTQVLDYTTNPLLQVMQGEGEILIPLQDAFVKRVDKKARLISVDLPEGLIDINKV